MTGTRGSRSSRRSALVLAGLAAALAACSVKVGSTTPGTVTTASSTTLDTNTATTKPGGSTATVRWHDCGSGYQCGTHTVPLDWFHSTGQTISLALIRHPAEDPSQRIGSLFLNPGGPGEPGVSFLRDFLSSGTVPKELLQRFDLVAWDPRGAGASSGVACIPPSEQERPAPDPTPNNAKAVAALTTLAKTDVARCLSEDGKVLPYVGTRETSHDLDALRAAVGDAKLHYLGFSYGTEIGEQYLRDFPSHVGGMVLDGVVVPGEDPIKSGHDQIKSFETDLNSFLADCKARGSGCTFGHGDPKGTLTAFLAKLETGVRLPADYTTKDDSGGTHTRTGTLGIGEALTGIITPLYSRDEWPALEKALTQATGAKDPNGYLLLSFRDDLQGRNQDGTWSHLPDAFAAIGCADQSARATSVIGSPTLITQWAKEMPFLGAVQATGQPGCFDWPAARYPVSTPTAADLAGAPPMVFVNSTADPATPYAQAVEMHKLVPGSRLVTWESADHTSFGRGHTCIDVPVTAYLVHGTLPGASLHCKP